MCAAYALTGQNWFGGLKIATENKLKGLK